MKSFKRHLEEKLKASDDMGDWVKDFQDSDAPQFNGKSMKKRQQMAVAAKLGAERNEEVELDEVSDKKLDRYRQKAFADQPAGDDGSNKYRKRKFGRDLAFAKQTGRAKVLATKEEVELDESRDVKQPGPHPLLQKANIKHTHRQSVFKRSKTYVTVHKDDYERAKKVLGNNTAEQGGNVYLEKE